LKNYCIDTVFAVEKLLIIAFENVFAFTEKKVLQWTVIAMD